MNKQKIYVLTGALCGYSYFIKELESDKMGNIIFRNGKFTLKNVWNYMKSPFKESYLWNKELLSTNWIITTCIGGLLGYTIHKLFI